jgi:hypothetical protein
MTRFLVVVPSHRPHLAQGTIDRLKESLTYPTEFHQLDGRPSKVHAINKALMETLDSSKHDVYCTVDDDLILPPNWQHSIACAFDRIPKLGICGIDYEGTAEGDAFISLALKSPKRQIRDIVFRDTIGYQNVAGGCMAMPTRIAKTVGPYPFSDDGRQYHLDEDGWRCRRVATMGHRYGYVVSPNGPACFVSYNDSPEYLSRKRADIVNWQENPSWDNR